MKKLLFPIIIATVVVLLCGCAAARKVPYFKNIDSINLAASKGLYDARIMPKDLLTIAVVTSDQETSRPFNLFANMPTTNGGSTGAVNSTVQQYLVNNDGEINFPVVGKLHVVGLTNSECEKLIFDKVKPYFSENENPVVTVRLSSYRVVIAGAVKSPGVVPVANEKMSIMEAIAQAGDLTIFGKRDNVLLIREGVDGQKEVHRLNLNDANLINSPYYYVQQNDYIYVEPNKVEANNAYVSATTSLWMSFLERRTVVDRSTYRYFEIMYVYKRRAICLGA